MIVLNYSESYFNTLIFRGVNVRRTMVGALIGFAVGLYVVSALSNNLFSEIYYATPLYVWGLIFINSIIMAGFCYFGAYLMSDIDESKERK